MSCDKRVRNPLLFGSPIVTGIARYSYLTDTGLIIPGIVARCFHEINTDLKAEGLFRRSGAASVLNQLQDQFEQCDNPFDVVVPAVTTVHCWTGLLKRYLQHLSDPLIPSSYQSLFLEAHGTENPLEKFQEIVQSLPLEHRHLLIYLLQSIYTIVDQKNSNQMTASTMAIIVAPTFIQMDAVSQLMQQSAPSLKPTRTPSWQKTARRLFNFSLRRHSGISQSLSSLSTHSVPFPLYQPQHILQLELVKQSAQWTGIVECLIHHSLSLLEPPKEKRLEMEIRAAKLDPEPFRANENSAATSLSKLPTSPTFIRQLKILDMSNLEFPASRELLNIFQDVHIPVLFNNKNTTTNTEPRQKYANTLQHWRSREQQFLNVDTLHTSKRYQPNVEDKKKDSSSDWLCMWSRKSLFIEPTAETELLVPHFEIGVAFK